MTDPEAGGVKSGVPDEASIKADLTKIKGSGNDAVDASSYSDPNASWTVTVENSTADAHQIVVTATDLVGNSKTGTAAAAINIDKTAPDAVSSLKATAAGAGKVKLEFSFSGTYDTDYYGIRFCRKKASEITDSLGYPRYDKSADYPCAGYETAKGKCNDDSYYPSGATEGQPVDVKYDSAPGDSVTHTDSPSNQDVYYYQGYAYDRAGNFSATATNYNGRDSATGYFLGDFTNDGKVDITDLDTFSNAFRTDSQHQAWDNSDDCDIGPTDDTQRRKAGDRFGLPKTDGKVDFEDLMIFSMNFDNVPPAPIYQPPLFPENTPLVALISDWRAVGVGEIFPVALKLSHQLKAKGAHLILNYDPSYFEVVKVTQGDLGMTFFSAEYGKGIIDISVAALGGDVPFADETIATVEFRVKGSSPQGTLYLSEIDVRGPRNERVDDKLSELGKVGLNLAVGKPDVTKIFHNYPNPFNPETWIPFQLEADANVSLKIYDTNGHLVKSIKLGQIPGGYYLSADRALRWDGRNDAGEKVSSGIYFYQLQTGKLIKTSRMAIVNYRQSPG